MILRVLLLLYKKIEEEAKKKRTKQAKLYIRRRKNAQEYLT
jgi:hypothetical protein